MRSHAFGLVVVAAPDEEIRAALTDADRNDLGDALESVFDEMQPAADIEIAAAVGAVVGLIGQDWSMSKREEFIGLATTEFMKLPGALVLDALARARRRVTAGRLLVAWVCDDVEPKAEKLKLECDRLTRLADIAVPAA
jgi:hypothetical protein